MPEYVSRELVRKILGADADQFDVELLVGTPPHFVVPKVEPYGLSVVQEMYDKARELRAYMSEDEGVTYP